MTNSLFLPLFVCAAIFPVLAIIAVALRFRARKVRGIGYGSDDWAILASLIVIIVAIGVLATSTQTFVTYERGVYIAFIFLNVSLGLVKVSLLELYKRIFAVRRFVIIANVFMVIVIGWTLAAIFASIFCTWPVSNFWNPKESFQGVNFNYGYFLAAITTLDITLDVVLLCLPLPMIGRLQMSTKRKIYLAGIFWLGIFCVISGAVRIYYAYRLAKAYIDPYHTGFTTIAVDCSTWGEVEPCCSIIAACLPCYGPLVRKNMSAIRSNGPSSYRGRTSRIVAPSKPITKNSILSSLHSTARTLIPSRSQGGGGPRSWYRSSEGQESIDTDHDVELAHPDEGKTMQIKVERSINSEVVQQQG